MNKKKEEKYGNGLRKKLQIVLIQGRIVALIRLVVEITVYSAAQNKQKDTSSMTIKTNVKLM